MSRVGTVGSDAFDWRRGPCRVDDVYGERTPRPGAARRLARAGGDDVVRCDFVRGCGGLFVSSVALAWACCGNAVLLTEELTFADRRTNISTCALPIRLLTEPTPHMTTSLLKKKTSPRKKNDTDRIRTCDTFVKGFQVLRLNHSATISRRAKISHWDSNPGSQNVSPPMRAQNLEC